MTDYAHTTMAGHPEREQQFRTDEPARPGPVGTLTNRQRIARYDILVERAQQQADEARSLTVRRKYLSLILRLQRRALRELHRGR